MKARKLSSYRILPLFLALAFLGSGLAPQGLEAKPEGVKEIIVEIKALPQLPKGTEKDSVKDLVSKYAKVKSIKQAFKGGIKSDKIKERNQRIFVIEVETTNLESLLRSLSKEESVAFSQPNYLYEKDMTPNDPMYFSQWAHSVTDISYAWDISTGNPSVAIAIIGTGVKKEHEDLAANIWVNSDELEGNSLDDDSNGYVDDVAGWNFVSNNGDASDEDGHETAVAGVAAAVANNNTGIAGVCSACKIMPLKVDYTTEDIVNAIYYAVDNGAKVINMSFGNYTPDLMLSSAVDYASSNGVILVGTAGNNSISDKRYPAAFEPVIAVASVNSSLVRSSFSNWGEWVDVAAPGEGVLSTSIAFDNYSQVSGTSFAAPYISGIAGLILSQYPELPSYEVRNRIEYTANKIAADKPIGSGLINGYRAINSSEHPGPFSVIKNIWENFSLPQSGTQDIWGSALGDSFTLSYKGEGQAEWTVLSSGSEVINGLLGSLNVSDLGSFASVELKLSTSKSLSSDSHILNLIPTVTYHPGFPKSVGTPIVSAANFYDFNDDGKKQIVFGDNKGLVHILNEDGTYLANWPQSVSTSYVFGPVAVGDITGDGLPEVVATSYGSYSGGAKVYAWRRDGVVLPGWPKQVGQTRGGAVLANVDSDLSLEVIVAAAGLLDEMAKVYAFDEDGSTLLGWPYTLPEKNLQTSPAIGDVNADGRVDIVVASLTKVAVLNTDGTLISLFNKGTSHTSPVLVNLDSDPFLEIIVTEPNALTAYSYTGSVEWSKPVYEEPYNQLSVGDLDNDGIPEVIYSGSNGSNTNTYVYSQNGNALPSWPKLVEGTTTAAPIIADVNGDNYLDVIVTSQSGNITAFDRNGAMIIGFPKKTGTILDSSVGVADLDNNGKVEMVALGEDGQVRVWDLNSTAMTSDWDWRVSRHDVENSGNIYHKVATSTGDTILPTVSIANPVEGATSTSPVSLEIQASDNIGIAKIEVFIGTSTAPVATLVEAPYNVLLPMQDGAQTLSAKAYDISGNTSLSAVSFTVITRDTTAPSTSILTPTEGSSVSSPVTVSAEATDNVEVSKVELYVDDLLQETFTAAPFTASIDLPAGNHSVYSKAYDASGNVQVSQRISFIVLDTVKPTVSITSPLDGSTVKRNSTLVIQANSSDNVAVEKVEFYINNVLMAADLTQPYSYSWLVPQQRGVTYTITAKAYDSAQNYSTSSVTVTSSR